MKPVLAALVPAALLLAACTTEDPVRGEAAAAEQGKKITFVCRPTSALSEAQRDAVEGAARAVVEAVRTGDAEDVWSSLHPHALDDDQHDPFVRAVEGMERRLNLAQPTTRLEHGFFVDVQGGASNLARIDCGSKDDPQALTLIANAAGEDLAVVTLLSDGSPFGYASTVTLRQRGTKWRLLGVQVGPASYRRQDASSFESVGDQLIRSGKTLEGFLALAVAQRLANRGASIKPARQLRVDGKLAEVADSHELADHVGPLIIDGKTYNVLGASLAATQSDISAVIKYVSPGGLVKEILDQEADILLVHLQQNYPDLAKLFDAVVFEAYANKPTAPQAEQDAYRTVRRFTGDTPVAEP